MKSIRLLLLCLFGCGMLGAQVVWAQQIRAVEYFFDQDPGVGKGKLLDINPDSVKISSFFQVPVAGLEPGPHWLVVRIQDTEGHWSLAHSARFLVEPAYELADTVQLIGVEYYIDTDPGVGKGTFVPFAQNRRQQVNQVLELDISGVAPGAHVLVIRAHSAKGDWGMPKYARFLLKKEEDPYTPDLPDITKAEYFINGPDPGEGMAKNLPIAVPAQQIQVGDSVDLDTTGLSIGRHHLLIRLQDETGRWSMINIAPFDYCSPDGVMAGFDFVGLDNRVFFTDRSRNAVNYIYDMGNGDSLLTNATEYRYPQGGNYTICQTVYSFCDTMTVCKDIFVPTPRVKTPFPTFRLPEDAPPTVLINRLLDYVEDPNGDPITFSVVSPNDSVVAQVINNSQLRVNGRLNYFGKTKIALRALAGGIMMVDSIPLEFWSVNDLPTTKITFRDVAYDEDTGPRVIARPFRSQFSDVDSDTIRFFTKTDNPNVLLTLRRDSLLVEMARDYVGTARLTLEVVDDSLGKAVFSFRAEIVSVPDLPIRRKSLPNITLTEDQAPATLMPDVREYYLDPDADPLTYEVVFEEGVGIRDTLIGNRLDLVPLLNYNGISQAILQVSDGQFITRDTFQITVSPINDPPVWLTLPVVPVCAGQPGQLPSRDFVADVDHAIPQIRFAARIVETIPAGISPSTLSIQQAANGTFTFSTTRIEPATYRVELTATDPANGNAKVLISVNLFGAAIRISGDTLYASEGDSYQWFRNGRKLEGETKRFYIPKGRTNYQVEVKKGNCTALSAPVVVTDLPNSALQWQFDLYPNPVRTQVTAAWSAPTRESGQVRIVDSVGKVFWEESRWFGAGEQSIELDVSDWPSGFYLFQIQTARGKAVKPFIKE